MLNYFNLALRFFLELGGLAAISVWGFNTGSGPLKFVLGLGAPFLAATVWGIFRVPNDPGQAPVAVPGALRLVLEAAFFGSAVAGLYASGYVTLAWVFGLMVLANYAMMYERLAWIIKQ